jgi:hypothetical protein
VKTARRKFYVALAPDGTRRSFGTWDECRKYRDANPGTRVQSVDTLEKAKQLVAGGVVLEAGHYAFTDGNALGGVGIVLLRSDGGDALDVQEVSTNVHEVFAAGTVPPLATPEMVSAALTSIHQILAELAAFYRALTLAPAGVPLTVVHDFIGVREWMKDRWRTKDAYTAAVVGACKNAASDRRLNLRFRHQRGHQSTWAGRDDYARWNARADELASQGAVDSNHAG